MLLAAGLVLPGAPLLTQPRLLGLCGGAAPRKRMQTSEAVRGGQWGAGGVSLQGGAPAGLVWWLRAGWLWVEEVGGLCRRDSGQLGAGAAGEVEVWGQVLVVCILLCGLCPLCYSRTARHRS